MKDYLNFDVFTDAELDIIVNASLALTNMLPKSQCFKSKLEMYQQFDQWRTIVNLQCSAFNELERRRKLPPDEVKKIMNI